MSKAIFLTVLILFSLYEHVTAVSNVLLCDKVDLTKFIEIPSDYRNCLQVAYEKDDEVSCVLKSLGLMNLTLFKVTSIQSLKYRNISSERGERCETFLIFAENLAEVKKIFENNQPSDTKQFFPFSKLYLYIFDQFNVTGANRGDIAAAARLKTFLHENALFGYMFEYSNEKVLIRDLLTNDPKRSIVSYTPSDLFHPIVDTRLAKDNFRISLFNCKPQAFYPENESYNTKVNELDGTEIRFVKEVTKNWNKTYNFRDFSQTKQSPYSVIASDILSGSTDMAICSIWMLHKNYEIYDLTKFYRYSCMTLMVPKPIKLHEATAIYAGLSVHVWLSFLCVFLLSCISLNFFSKMETRLHRKHDQYTDFQTTFMETVSIVTSHSLHRYSTSDKMSAQTVLTSWILFSVWIDVCYITIYTSRITSPSFEKPIDTVKQFVEHDMYICSRYVSDDLVNELRASMNEDDRKLSTRSLAYGTNQLYRQQLIDERKCGLFASPLMPSYIAMSDDYENLKIRNLFRLMKSCVKIHYTAFGFRKYSPYTKLFDWHIRRYQEHGILKKWYSDMMIMRRLTRFDDVDRPEKSLHQITVVDISGSLLILCSGLILSMLSFLVEIIIGH